MTMLSDALPAGAALASDVRYYGIRSKIDRLMASSVSLSVYKLLRGNLSCFPVTL